MLLWEITDPHLAEQTFGQLSAGCFDISTIRI